ncbi:MAG: AAA family ATPase [Oscillospiraceae bacterium]|nr:AAA family ATPase [Oscillospiraceae bacterium]
MLSQLSITNIAVIQKAEIAFENGFNVFTGETGTGKSILYDLIIRSFLFFFFGQGEIL